MITVAVKEEGFHEWQALLTLLFDAFAYMETRIDPPSSLGHLNEETVVQKAAEETLLLAREEGKLIGCCFLKDMGEKIYLGKLAVNPKAQQSGIGLALVNAAIDLCRAEGKKLIELQSRVELTEVHDFFRRCGFRQTGTTAHKGYDRPTSITMQLEL
ncbi:GNAT family N-acetyltransferase [Sneathiella sp.]|uniref:GNAT family N-acetyltransferase n=1 Tax=Sneathiella sp. TaxID=1964365 RepID=UPI00262E163D|nr:GNAT family N-acetyltransferase [Sneathiella sp.]MDF2365881.1 GNAT family N-acetyltransferase [Sneathiella sp.]